MINYFLTALLTISTFSSAMHKPSEEELSARELISALHGKNTFKARQLILCGTNANICHGDTSALHMAARLECPTILALILKHGGNVNIRTSRGTPIHEAVSYNRAANIRYLLDHGADVDARDAQQKTPLHQAAIIGVNEIITILLQAGADVNAQCSSGRTPLYDASTTSSDEKCLRLLLEHGAARNTCDKEGKAIFDNDIQSTYNKRILIKAGVNPLLHFPLEDHFRTPKLVHLLHRLKINLESGLENIPLFRSTSPLVRYLLVQGHDANFSIFMAHRRLTEYSGGMKDLQEAYLLALIHNFDKQAHQLSLELSEVELRHLQHKAFRWAALRHDYECMKKIISFPSVSKSELLRQSIRNLQPDVIILLNSLGAQLTSSSNISSEDAFITPSDIIANRLFALAQERLNRLSRLSLLPRDLINFYLAPMLVNAPEKMNLEMRKQRMLTSDLHALNSDEQIYETPSSRCTDTAKAISLLVALGLIGYAWQSF